MATQTIVIGKEQCQSKVIPIKFLYQLDTNCTEITAVRGTGAMIQAWNYIELICPNYNLSGMKSADRYDLMFAYDHPDNRCTGTLFIGQWNDGVVE